MVQEGQIQMTYKIVCSRCGRVEKYNYQDEAIQEKCGGCNGTFNGVRIKIQLCSKCYSPKNLVEEFDNKVNQILEQI